MKDKLNEIGLKWKEELREGEINGIFNRKSTMKTIAMEKVGREEKNTKN